MQEQAPSLKQDVYPGFVQAPPITRERLLAQIDMIQETDRKLNCERPAHVYEAMRAGILQSWR